MLTDDLATGALWLGQPAQRWEEGLPVGNGRLGAMVLGGVPHERIGVNEDTFWSGPADRSLPKLPAGFVADVDALVRAGRHREADERLQALQGADAEAYQPIGDLLINHRGWNTARGDEYRRTLDLRDGIARVRTGTGSGLLSQEVFVSAQHDVIVVRLDSGGDPFDIELALHTPQQRHELRVEGADTLALLLSAPRHVFPWPRSEVQWDDDGTAIRAAALVHAHAQESAVTIAELPDGTPSLRIRGGTTVTVLVAIRTSFTRWDIAPAGDSALCLARARRDIERVRQAGWPAIRSDHCAEHRALMDRVSLHLGADGAGVALPVDVRLQRRAEGQPDEQLAALAFAFGRYLLLAASRPGTQPATLQGVWNAEVTPPWSCEYTTNINLEMNYWAAEPANLPECHEPLLRAIGELADAGGEVAGALYRAGGWTCHHNTDLWRLTAPVGSGQGQSCWSAWPMAGAWLALHLAEHWRFGRDPEFLATALPIVIGAARFVLDRLSPDGEHLVTSPATSPENLFETADGPAAVDISTAMDTTLARELFEFALEAAGALADVGLDPAHAAVVDEIRRALPRLMPMCIGSRGQLLEWHHEHREVEPHHRHVSHLVGLYPGRSLATDDRGLTEAARIALIERGDAGTGWSLVWKAALWSRLHDGEAAHRLVNAYLTLVDAEANTEHKGGVYASLLCAHPPFQIDGSLGITAAIAEMLVQSHRLADDAPIIELLPALPAAWPQGEVRGLRARGGITIERLAWADGVVTEVQLRAYVATAVVVQWNGGDGRTRRAELALCRGECCTLRA